MRDDDFDFADAPFVVPAGPQDPIEVQTAVKTVASGAQIGHSRQS
jgi:hypothetical protein